MSAAAKSEPVEVRILDREYLVACPEDERDDLIAAAKLLDKRMREVRDGNRLAGIDRIAVLAALNLAHDLHSLGESRQRGQREERRTLEDLCDRLDRLLAQAES